MKLLTNLNLEHNELQNALMHPLSSAPAEGQKGQLYYNNVENRLYEYNGAAWVGIAKMTDLEDKADLTDGKVNAAQTSSKIVTITASTTLSADHAGKCFVCSNSSAITITVPAGILEAETEIEFIQYGAGSITFAAASGVTINAKDGFKTSNGQYSVVVCKQIASNTWILSGSLA